MFKDAKVLTTPDPKSTKKKASKEQTTIVGLQHLAELSALIKALEGVKKTFEEDVKSAAFDIFVENTTKGVKPENFQAFEGTSNASIQMKKRSTTSVLSADEVALLEEHGVKPFKQITSNKLFGINPEYAENEDLLNKVEAALKDIVPSDFIVLQPEKFKWVVSDDTVKQAFGLDEPQREVIQAVTTLAVRPSLQETKIVNILDAVKVLFEDKNDVDKILQDSKGDSTVVEQEKVTT